MFIQNPVKRCCIVFPKSNIIKKFLKCINIDMKTKIINKIRSKKPDLLPKKYLMHLI